MAGDISAFQPPQQTIDFAKAASAEAELAIKSFINYESFLRRVDEDPVTGEKSLVVYQALPLDPTIVRKLTESLNNARNSFDQSLFAACKAIGRPVKDSHFPWADNPDPSLTFRLQRKKTGEPLIHREFWDVIRAQEPYPTGDKYPGGDDLIRQISTLANSKHTIGCDVLANYSSSIRNIIFNTGPTGRLNIDTPSWDSVKKEIVLMKWGGGMVEPDIKGRLSFRVAFRADPPLGHIAAITALEQFVAKAQSVLDAFKTRAIELGAS